MKNNKNLKVDISWCCQLAALARPGCATATATVRTTRMRTTARRWCASCLTTCVPLTIPSACPPRSCVTAPTIVPMDLTRSFVVKHSLHAQTHLCTSSTTRRCVQYPVILSCDNQNTTNTAHTAHRPSVLDALQHRHLFPACRFVFVGQRWVQPQLQHHSRGGLHVLLSPGYGAGSRQQDLPDSELLRQTPQVQPEVRAGEIQRQVFLLRGLGTGGRHGELQEHR